MKKIMIFLFLLLIPIVIFAQDVIPPPTSVTDVLANIKFWAGSLAPAIILATFVSALIIKLFKITGSGLKQIVSWLTGGLLVVVFNLFAIGLGVNLAWYGVLAYGAAVSIGANLGYDAGFMQSILEMLNLVKSIPIPPTDITNNPTKTSLKK